MANDTHDNPLSVKEGSSMNTYRSSVIDSRERHTVCKLDRYQLEDRYLRLLDEVIRLKKLSNSQEDKIKRLATKLMRVAATPRSCVAPALETNNDKNRLDHLEHENAKLKERITVLRNQILNHKIGRSRSRSRRLEIFPSSGLSTFRSELGQVESRSSQLVDETEDVRDRQKNLGKIEALEQQKSEMTTKIADLESQLENNKVENQREKAAENVEFIRIWRQMKQRSEELASAQTVNASLIEQIRDLKELLEEKKRNYKEINGALMAEKQKLAEMDEQLARAKDSELSLREKDEQIKDLMSEMKILHEHNAELIALSSKYSQVQEVNAELKRKISEQLLDHQSLKSAFSNEKANITALQAANEQLVGKLHDLQRNIDRLTIQLKILEAQNEKLAKSEPELRIVRTVERETSTNSLPGKVVESSKQRFDRKVKICDNCCQEFRERIPVLQSCMINRETQTEKDTLENLRDSSRVETKEKSAKRGGPQSPMRPDRSFQPDNGSASLMPEEMLKLLEQAQINMPQNLPREYSNSKEPGQSQREYSAESPGYRNPETSVTRTLNGVSRTATTNNSSIYKQEHGERDNRYDCCPRDFTHSPFRNIVSDIGNCIQKAFDNIHMSRLMRVDGTLDDNYKSWQPSNTIGNSRSGSLNEHQSNGYGQAKSGSIRIPLNTQAEEQSSRPGQRENVAKDSESTKNRSPNLRMGEITSRANNGNNGPDKGASATLRGLPVNDASQNNSSSQRESMVDSFLSTSPGQSDSSMIRSTEDEDAMSEAFRKKPLISSTKKLVMNVKGTSTEEDTERIDSDSVNEFNHFLRNNITSSPRESSSSVQDVGHVFSDDNWHEYRKRSMEFKASSANSSGATAADKSDANQSTDRSPITDNSVTIRIESLSLDEECPLLEDSQVQRLYIEFSFLGYHGADLETISVDKPTANATAYFNYVRKFEIDKDEHQIQRNIVRAMMTDNDNPVLKFIVVSEPLPDEMETKECTEVGYAYFNIHDYVLSGQSEEASLEIVNTRQTEPIGSLKITLVGKEAIRRCMSEPA